MPCLPHDKKGVHMADKQEKRPKRPNGEGTLRSRADGRLERTIMFGFRDDGTRKTKTFYGKDPKEVNNKVKKYLKELDAGLVVDKEYLFSEWADIWFEHHKHKITPMTQEYYQYTLRCLKEAFGKRKIKDIKAFDVETFLYKLHNEGRSDSCISKCRAMLYQIFNKAEANDFILKNPVRFVEKMKKSGPLKSKDSFTSEEVNRLMSDLPDNRIGWSIRLMLGTGMRTQEILALEPRHIEPDGSCIYIRQAVNMVKGTPVIGAPKSKDSYRDIPVPENVRWCAVNLRMTDTTYIWEMKKKDCPCNPSAFRNHYKKALEAIPGVRVLSPHSCRHTYISQMQALGVDLATIQSIVGHADVDMTQHYLHVQESIRQDAIARFNNAFATNPKNESF